MQKHPSSTRHIQPFIQAFDVDEKEFLDPVTSFCSFNDFFIRKLNPDARPISANPSDAIIPADGRYYFYSNIQNM